MMLHTIYQGSTQCGFRQEDFSGVKKVASEWGHFGPQANNLNKLSRGQQNDSTYQISWLKVLWCQTIRFFHVFLFSLCKPCDHWGVANFGPRGII